MALWLALGACVACGLASGFLAGLLGLGGGLLVVPALALLLPAALGPLPLLPQMAVATSLAAMVPTTLTALASQHRRGAVHRAWLLRLAPWVCVGAWGGATLMPALDARLVAAAFLAYASYFSLRLWRAAGARPMAAPWVHWPSAPVAAAIGVVSVLAGVGGAIFTVPYLEGRRLPMTHAVGTSSGVALLLSVVAVLALHGGSTALVWWPGALAIGLAAVATAPLGVHLAHRWPVARLKRAFAGLLVFAAVGSLWKVAHG
jgi:uncharacterized membrane protein YfcA